MGGHTARKGEMRSAYKILIGQPEGKIPFDRHRREWKDVIKMNLKE
jgi:hypothetical protein